jgi:ribosomal protein L16/L10AE
MFEIEVTCKGQNPQIIPMYTLEAAVIQATELVRKGSGVRARVLCNGVQVFAF